MAGPLGLEDPGPPAPAWDIKDVFPEETIDWKHVSVIIIYKILMMIIWKPLCRKRLIGSLPIGLDGCKRIVQGH